MDYLSSQEMLILGILNESEVGMSRRDMIDKTGNILRKSKINIWLRNLVRRGDISYRKVEKDDLGRFLRRFYRITDQGVNTLVNQTLAEKDL